MKFKDAMRIINSKDEPKGFMVTFEWLKDGILESDYFPDKHEGERLIRTEKEAWELAERFARKMKKKVVNIYVVNDDFSPVKNYKSQYIKNR